MSLPTRTKREVVVCVILMLSVGSLRLCATALAQRRLAAGEDVPEFSTADLAGRIFNYKHGSNRVLMVAFLSAEQERSARAATDIKQVVGGLPAEVNNLDVVVVVVDDPNRSWFQTAKDAAAKKFHIVSDADFKLWGKFGIIAMPTVILGGANDKVLWVKAGHEYAFASLLRANLNRALGIAQATDPNEAGKVEAVANDTVAARVKRHLQMARMLEQKGRVESAIAQIEEARALDPNSLEAVMSLAELLCRVGRGKEALDLIGQLDTAKRLDKAQLLLIRGWAMREMGDLDTAEELLLKATNLNPESSRAFFELGKIYQARKQTDKAMASYYRALAIIFDEESPPVGSHY